MWNLPYIVSKAYPKRVSPLSPHVKTKRKAIHGNIWLRAVNEWAKQMGTHWVYCSHGAELQSKIILFYIYIFFQLSKSNLFFKLTNITDVDLLIKKRTNEIQMIYLLFPDIESTRIFEFNFEYWQAFFPQILLGSSFSLQKCKKILPVVIWNYNNR